MMLVLYCRTQHFFYGLNKLLSTIDLDEPVDVYSAWIDACEEVNKAKKAAAARARNDAKERDDDNDAPAYSNQVEQGVPYDDEDDEDDEY